MHSVQHTSLLYEIYLSPQYATFLYVHTVYMMKWSYPPGIVSPSLMYVFMY